MALPLENVRVLDFTRMMQGPHATQMLGDLGADIIKVEHPKTPNNRPDQRYGPHGGYGKKKEENVWGATNFIANNRNKRSLTVDLKAEKGKEIIRRLVRICDVSYENFRPGVMDRLGFGYEDCRKINPSIIYASASGYGPSGPYEKRPGQDLLAQALGGWDDMNATADGRPLAVGFSVIDLLGAMYGAWGVLAALYHRQTSGEGQKIDVCLLDSAVAALSENATHFLNTGEEAVRATPAHAAAYINPPYGVYRTKDGYISISGGVTLPNVCRVLGLPNLAEDPRFDDYFKLQRNQAEFEAILEEALGKKTTAEWMPLMEQADLWAAPVQTFPQVFSDPQVLHNNMVVTIEGPYGPLRLPGIPYKLSRTPAQIRLAPPLLGQHTDEILHSLGYSEAEIATMRKEEVIR